MPCNLLAASLLLTFYSNITRRNCYDIYEHILALSRLNRYTILVRRRVQYTKIPKERLMHAFRHRNAGGAWDYRLSTFFAVRSVFRRFPPVQMQVRESPRVASPDMHRRQTPVSFLMRLAAPDYLRHADPILQCGETMPEIVLLSDNLPGVPPVSPIEIP